MKDRLSELQRICSKPSEAGDCRPDEGDGQLEQHAVVFQGEDLMDDTFKEAQLVQKEIALLRLDVKRLGRQNTRFLTSVRRISSIKRDSNAIARDIKVRGEIVYARLEKLGKQCKDLENEHGVHAALVRIMRYQYFTITNYFHKAMSEYNESEMAQKENCKTRIHRQAEIMGKDLRKDQIEEMIETGKWNVYSENLLTDARAARSALAEIENRHKELMQLESRIKDIHELFFQMALLVEEQGVMLDNIEKNVLETQDYVEKATTHIKKAVKYKKSNACKRLFCCCFSCCN